MPLHAVRDSATLCSGAPDVRTVSRTQRRRTDGPTERMVRLRMASAFHLIALPVSSEEATLQAALDSLADVEPGEAVFFSEAIAWTSDGSGVAYTRLVRAARQKDVNLVATLNLGGELAEDLPGHDPSQRYHAVVMFTRHGHVHVPQAKCLPDAAERSGSLDDEGLVIAPYMRSNLIRLDMDEQLIEIRFLVGADIALITDHPPAAFSCDVLFSLARMPLHADDRIRETLADARAAGLSSTTVQINGTLARLGKRPGTICKKVEEAADSGRAIAARPRWPNAAKLQKRLYRNTARRRDHEPAAAISKLERDPKRKGRIPVFRPPRAPKVGLGVYPVTIVF